MEGRGLAPRQVRARELGPIGLALALVRLAASAARESLDLGLSYRSSSPYGAVRARIVGLCVATIRDAVADMASLEGDTLKENSVKRKLRQALLDALNADIAADEHLTPEMLAQRDRVEARLFQAEPEPLPLAPRPLTQRGGDTPGTAPYPRHLPGVGWSEVSDA